MILTTSCVRLKRDLELVALRKVVYLDASLSFLWQSAPMLVALACFTAFIFADPGWLT